MFLFYLIVLDLLLWVAGVGMWAAAAYFAYWMRLPGPFVGLTLGGMVLLVAAFSGVFAIGFQWEQQSNLKLKVLELEKNKFKDSKQ